ncbi:unnamed protein product [Discosporangium mesarthrocarpum]
MMRAGGGGYQPPGTGMRMGTAQRGPMGTAAGRPMSGRLRTGQTLGTPSREAAYGLALSQEVKVTDRPVTQQGMSGMKTAAGGPGRQVQDSSFFIGVLRNKMNLLQKETKRLQDEIEQHNKDSAHYGHMERTYESLLQEVKQLEGTVADYNLAVDKSRTTADPGEVAAYLHNLEDQNRREARELDETFLMKQQRQKASQELEAETMSIHRKARRRMEEKINDTEPEMVNDYRALLQRHQTLQAEAAQGQATGQGGKAALQGEYKELEKAVGRLRREGENLQLDLEIATMDPKQARERLLAKVKSDQDRLKQLDARAAEIGGVLKGMRRQLTELDADLTVEKKGEISQSKVEVLRKRDQEMTTFIENYEPAKANALQDQRVAKETIVGLLEHISQRLDEQLNIPSQDKMKELEDENSFKDKQLKSSEITMRRLQQEKEKRQQEIAKINTLDEKIPLELDTLKDRLDKMTAEMKEFEDVDGLRERATATKEHLQNLNMQYTRRRDAMRVQVQQLSAENESNKKILASSETGKTLEALEQKLRTYETNIFSLREFVETKGREIDYESLHSECKSMVEELNETIKNMDMSPSYGAAY